MHCMIAASREMSDEPLFCSVQLHFSGAKVLKNRYLAAGLFRSADETAALVDKFAGKCRQKNPPGLSAGAEVKI